MPLTYCGSLGLLGFIIVVFSDVAAHVQDVSHGPGQCHIRWMLETHLRPPLTSVFL